MSRSHHELTWSLDDDAVTARQESTRSTEPRWFIPLHYEPEYRYPLIAWLDMTNQPLSLASAMAGISMRNHCAVAPGNSAFTTGWSDSAATAISGISNLLQQAQRRLSVHPQRLFIVQREGSLTETLALLDHPQAPAVAGLIWITSAPEIAGRILPTQTTRQLPLAICIPDRTIAIEATLRTQRVLHAMGHDPIVLVSSERPAFLANALPNVNRWIMEKVTGQSSFPTAEAAPAPAISSN